MLPPSWPRPIRRKIRQNYPLSVGILDKMTRMRLKGSPDLGARRNSDDRAFMSAGTSLAHLAVSELSRVSVKCELQSPARPGVKGALPASGRTVRLCEYKSNDRLGNVE